MAKFTKRKADLGECIHENLKILEGHIAKAESALALLRETETVISSHASQLRALLNREWVQSENEHRRTSRQRPHRKAAAGGKVLDSAMPPLPRPRASKRKVGARKRLPAQPINP